MASKRNSRGRETTPLMEYRRRRRDDPYGPTFPNDSFDKEDRRPILGRMTTAFSTMFSPIVVAVSSRRNDGRNSPLTNVSTKGFANLNPKHQEDDDEFYEDNYNELPWKCSFGTTEEDGIWMNRNDSAGIIMVSMVWLLLLYSIGTVAWLAHHQHLPGVFASVYGAVAALALASHAKTSLTDPGAIPRSAIPCGTNKNAIHLMCTHCQSYKPPKSHHCRICNRCVSLMDHHCPWMNNCVGVGNMKHFILFLVYTWMSSSLALVIFAWSYFLCSTDGSSTCNTSPSLVLVNLIRAMTVIAVGALIFTTSMIASITLGITTGLGTIDRMKIKATQNIGDTSLKAPPLSWEDAEDPIPLNHVFGDQGHWTWWLPIDPIWDDYERVVGYATRDRLNREQLLDRESDSRDSEFEGYSQV